MTWQDEIRGTQPERSAVDELEKLYMEGHDWAKVVFDMLSDRIHQDTLEDEIREATEPLEREIDALKIRVEELEDDYYRVNDQMQRIKEICRE
jgi:chaperonin cofactor prefoldin